MRQTWNRASANTLGTSSAIRQEAARRSRSGLRTLAGLAASALLLAGCAGQSPLSSGPGADALLAQAEQQQGPPLSAFPRLSCPLTFAALETPLLCPFLKVSGISPESSSLDVRV